MLLPYSIVDASVRRWPVVTFVLVALNAVCFLGELIDWRASRAEVASEYQSAVAYHEAHSYLRAPPILAARARSKRPLIVDARDPPRRMISPRPTSRRSNRTSTACAPASRVISKSNGPTARVRPEGRH